MENHLFVNKRDIYILKTVVLFNKKQGCFSFVFFCHVSFGGEPILGRFKVIVSWRIPGKGQSLLCESYDAMFFLMIFAFILFPLIIYIYIYLYIYIRI